MRQVLEFLSKAFIAPVDDAEFFFPNLPRNPFLEGVDEVFRNEYEKQIKELFDALAL